MKLTVTTAHLDLAVRQKLAFKGSLSSSVCCPVAQALIERFPYKRVVVAGNGVKIGGQLRPLTPTMEKVMNLFDDKKFTELRGLLPVSFVIRDIEAG
jgi:hypothetical protein